MDKIRATCWSITINNPTEMDMSPNLPAGWRIEGQMERGEKSGTLHYQAMLTTPQTRQSAVKKVFPRARIEVARNRHQLENYVHKDETRVAEVPTMVSSIPTLFDYQGTVAAAWDDAEWDERQREWHNKLPDTKLTIDDVAMEYCDYLVSKDIERGVRGVEYIAVNPMWRSAWRRFWPSIIKRHRRQTDRQTGAETE